MCGTDRGADPGLGRRAPRGPRRLAGGGAGNGVRWVARAPRESWKAINHALALGLRGLPGDSSLAELLAEHRGAPARHGAAGAGREDLGLGAGAVPDQGAAEAASQHAGLRRQVDRRRDPGVGGRLLASRKPPRKPPLTLATIRAWAERHEKATGFWPARDSGPIAGVPGDAG